MGTSLCAPPSLILQLYWKFISLFQVFICWIHAAFVDGKKASYILKVLFHEPTAILTRCKLFDGQNFTYMYLRDQFYIRDYMSVGKSDKGLPVLFGFVMALTSATQLMF